MDKDVEAKVDIVRQSLKSDAPAQARAAIDASMHLLALFLNEVRLIRRALER
jgi:hypothetical protein